MLGFEAWVTRWEAQTLPLCYTPPVEVVKVNALKENKKEDSRNLSKLFKT